MFFQEPTPDTSGYMIAGYAVAFIVMSLYVASFYLRNRNLNQELEMLEELDQTAVELETNQPKSEKPTKTVTKRGHKKEQ